MKNFFRIIIFFFTLSTFSQVTVRPGIKLGANIANITNTDFDSKIGLQAGAFATIRLSKFYAIQPEILYSDQGAESNIAGLNDVDIDYISILITNKFYIIPDSGLHVLLGPSFDISIDDSFYDIDAELEYSPFDFGLFAGIGYEFDFGLMLEARYKHGLVNVDYFADFTDESLRVEDDVLNTLFQVAMAYKFDF